jgi:hypothetical protein
VDNLLSMTGDSQFSLQSSSRTLVRAVLPVLVVPRVLDFVPFLVRAVNCDDYIWAGWIVQAIVPVDLCRQKGRNLTDPFPNSVALSKILGHLDLLLITFRRDVKQSTIVVEFRSLYGSSPSVIATVWADLITTEINDARVDVADMTDKCFRLFTIASYFCKVSRRSSLHDCDHPWLIVDALGE